MRRQPEFGHVHEIPAMVITASRQAPGGEDSFDSFLVTEKNIVSYRLLRLCRWNRLLEMTIKTHPLFPSSPEGTQVAQLTLMASNLHLATQEPHLMHFSWLMTCGFLTTPVMAAVGQTRAQAVQPTHFSAMIS